MQCEQRLARANAVARLEPTSRLQNREFGLQVIGDSDNSPQPHSGSSWFALLHQHPRRHQSSFGARFRAHKSLMKCAQLSPVALLQNLVELCLSFGAESQLVSFLRLAREAKH